MKKSLKLIEKSMQSMGMSFGSNLNERTITNLLSNSEVRYAFVNAVRKQVELKLYIEKYGAYKPDAKIHEMKGVTVIDEKTRTFSSGNWGH